MAVRRLERKAVSKSTLRAIAPSANISLLAIVLVSLLWRLPSFFDPPWVNDEGTYFAVAQAMAHGYRLYADVWENKPPGIYLLYSAVYHSLGASLIALRVTSAALTAFLVVVTYRLGAQTIGRLPASFAALTVGLILGLPFLEGTTLNAELPLAVLSASGMYAVLVRGRPGLAGACMAGALAFKAVASFDAAALAIWLFLHCRGQLLRYVIGAAVTATLGCLVVWRTGILAPMLRDALFYDLGYVGHGNGGSIPWVLALKVLGLGLATVALRRASLFHLWLVYSVVGALFSGRVFGHYAIQAMVPLALSGAQLGSRFIGARQFAALPFIFTSAALCSAALGWSISASGHDSIFARRLQYYTNFARYALHTESYAQYSAQIDDHVIRNRQIARTVKTLPAGKLLVWGNTPWVYVLSARLPVTPYTSALRQPEVPGETTTLRWALSRHRPAVVVVIDPPSPTMGPARSALLSQYRLTSTVANGRIYARASMP
jgi:4-amino-4-deoxy-L-arabinose transferase-like glycosyltransferase